MRIERHLTAALHSLERLDNFLAANPDFYIRVACPSQEFGDHEMSQGVGRWFSCVRGLWESLSLAIEPRLALVMLQAPPVDDEVMRYMFDLLAVGRNVPIDDHSRHALINLPDYRSCHLSEKFLQAPDLLGLVRSVLGRARRRGQAVQGLSCFASSHRMVRLAEILELDLLETPPETLIWGTKAGGRQIFRQAAVGHPAGTYAAERSLERLAETLVTLATDEGTGRWLLKLNEEFGSGHGNAVIRIGSLGIDDVIAVLERDLSPVCPDVSRLEFLSHVTTMGAVAEKYLEPVRGGKVSFPSAVGYLVRRADARIDIEILGTHEQMIGSNHDFIGCSFPANSAYRQELLRITRQVLRQLAKVGVWGHVGVDFVARSGPGGVGPWMLDATEINLRQTGSTHPNRTVRAVVDGQWRADGSLLDQAAQEIVYTGTDGLISDSYRGIPARSLVAALRIEPSLSFDAMRTRGVVPHLWTTLEPFGKIGATVIGRSVDECAELQGQFISLLDRLSIRNVRSGG